MGHPTDGTLRRLVDEPAGVATADREHVADCPVCLSALATARQEAAETGAALAVEFDVDVDAGWRRLSHAATADGRRKVAVTAPARRWHAVLRSPVLAAVGAVALVTGAGVAAAADWFQIFRAEQISPVTAPEAELITLPELDDLGEIEVTEPVDIRQVAGPEAAAEASGLDAPRVNELPQGVTGAPTYYAAGQASAVFTFSAEKTAQTVAAKGETVPAPPPGLDGSRFRFVAGPGLAEVWPEARGVPAMVVARVVAPTAHSSGIPFATARDYLLSLPGLPEDIVAQLRGFTGDGKTLPLFVSSDEMTSATADVGGTRATVLSSRSGTVSGVVWVDDGVVTAVAGSLSTDEVLSVARGLRGAR